MELKKDARWSLVVPTSMGIRLSSAQVGQPVESGTGLFMQATSAESNVATIASSLGLPVKVLTAFVEGSPVANFIKGDLRSRGMEFEGPEVEQGGPWGYRHQINIADSGFGARGPRVWNDRAGEVGRTLDVKDFDLERLFVREGVGILHLSGLIAALSPGTGRFCLELARAAHEAGTSVSFDLNHRATFWEGREKELSAIFSEIASVSDILIGNEEDFQLALGIEGPEAGGKDISAKMEGFKGMIEEARKRYPRVKVFATTLREVLTAGRHLWGAVLWENGLTNGSADVNAHGGAISGGHGGGNGDGSGNSGGDGGADGCGNSGVQDGEHGSGSGNGNGSGDGHGGGHGGWNGGGSGNGNSGGNGNGSENRNGDGSWHTVEPREITVLDRIGGGDGFVGGVLYAILRGWEPEKWIRFGWSTGALATTFLTDYARPVDEEQVWSVWNGNARVLR